MKRSFFRVGDRVTIHKSPYTGFDARGRVICTNRKSKYGLSVIVLVDNGDCEMVESFTETGGRYLPGSPCTITLGWANGETG